MSVESKITRFLRAQAELTRRVKPISMPCVWCPEVPSERQAAFLALDSEEACYGGAAGGGKSSALLMSALQWVHVPGYAALILRRTYSDLALPGAIMDRAGAWLQNTPATWANVDKRWRFPSGASLSFGYLESDADRHRYQGAEFQYVGIDEATQLSEVGALYMRSRIRRREGVRVPLRFRLATNPGGIGHEWVHQRYVREGAQWPFTPAKLADNPHLDREAYARGLAALDTITRAQLLEGHWIRSTSGLVYRFDPTRNVGSWRPQTPVSCVISCDLGASQTSPTTALSVCAWAEGMPQVWCVRAYATSTPSPSDVAMHIRALEVWCVERGWSVERIVVDAGALGAGYVQEFVRRHEIRAQAAEKRDKAGARRIMNGALERGELMFEHTGTESLCRELGSLEWRDEQQIETVHGVPDHETDALCYGFRAARAYAEVGAELLHPKLPDATWWQSSTTPPHVATLEQALGWRTDD